MERKNKDLFFELQILIQKIDTALNKEKDEERKRKIKSHYLSLLSFVEKKNNGEEISTFEEEMKKEMKIATNNIRTY